MFAFTCSWRNAASVLDAELRCRRDYYAAAQEIKQTSWFFPPFFTENGCAKEDEVMFSDRSTCKTSVVNNVFRSLYDIRKGCMISTLRRPLTLCAESVSLLIPSLDNGGRRWVSGSLTVCPHAGCTLCPNLLLWTSASIPSLCPSAIFARLT